jgi:hypothetical protein
MSEGGNNPGKADMTLPYSSSPTLPMDQWDGITPERNNAAKSCNFLGAILIILCMCGVFSLLSMGLWNAPVLTLVSVLFQMAAGITLFICGIRIQKGGSYSVIIALVVAVLIATLQALNFVSTVALGMILRSPAVLISIAIVGVLLIALCRLVFFLIKVLRQPRVPRPSE